jgi:thymidylate kinase
MRLSISDGQASGDVTCGFTLANPTRIPFRKSSYSAVYLCALKPDAAIHLDVFAEVGLYRIRRQRTVLQKLELEKRLHVDFKAERLTP